MIEYEDIRKRLEEAREIADDYWVKTHKQKHCKLVKRMMEKKLRKLDEKVMDLEIIESGWALALHLKKEGNLSDAYSVMAGVEEIITRKNIDD